MDKNENKHAKDNQTTIESHEYDGIKELNNPAPVWIMVILFLSIGFSMFYAIYYFGYPGNNRDQVSEYERKVSAFAAEKEAMKANNPNALAILSADQLKEQGAKLFLEKGCIACHGMKGEGNAIGPNLTDDFWLHGCAEIDLVKIITEGVPEKGMTPYKAMMSEDQIKVTAQYIQQILVGSNPENAKEPQGLECK